MCLRVYMLEGRKGCDLYWQNRDPTCAGTGDTP